MILICSAGHKFDTTHPFRKHLKVGDRCPETISYNLLGGSVWCSCVLFDKDTRPENCSHDFRVGDRVNWMHLKFQVVRIYRHTVWLRLIYSGRLGSLYRGVQPAQLTKIESLQ